MKNILHLNVYLFTSACYDAYHLHDELQNDLTNIRPNVSSTAGVIRHGARVNNSTNTPFQLSAGVISLLLLV
jgi:hypothetical protein